MPLRSSSRQRSAVRRSCQTMALQTGSPVRRSQTTTVSRWFVTPMAASWAARMPTLPSASATTASVLRHISRASCSTQPGRGYIWPCSRYACPTGTPARLKTMKRVPVVPWSIAPM